MIAAMPLRGLRAHNMLRWGLFGALGMGLLSLSAGSGTLAFFTTQVQSNNNTFTAGNLRFNISDSLSTTGQYPSIGSSLSLLNMKPGDAVYAPIKLTNIGNIDAKFGIKYTTSSELASTSDVNGGVVSAPLNTQLIDSGRTVANGLTFGAPAYAAVNGSFVLITNGTGVGEFQQITSVAAPDTLNTTAFTSVLDSTTRYSVVPFAGTVGSGSVTTLVDAGTPLWIVNQWQGYTASDGTNTSKVVSNTATTLTVSPVFGGTPSGPYTITRTNLAPALNLGIVGKGTGTGTAGTGAGAHDCNLTNYALAGEFSEQVPSGSAPLISPARVLAPMLAVGQTINQVSATDGTVMVATTGSDILCMQVSWTDHLAPLSLTTEDNAYNGATPGAYSTNINFVFDGQ
jgi:predicted ribosomally synthesized peptide with SipW-like signal peptide